MKMSKAHWFVIFTTLGFIFCLMAPAAIKPYEVTAPVSFFADQGAMAPTIDGFIDADEYRFSAQSSGASGTFWYIRWDYNFDGEGISQTGIVDSIDEGDEPISVDDCRLDVYTMYDDEYLYVAIRVVDDFISVNDNAEGEEDGSTWNDDSVEIFIDGDYSQFDQSLTSASTGDQAREFATGGQFVITANNAHRDNEAGNPTFGEDGDWYARAELTGTGYDTEFKIKLSKIGNPTKGSKIGFNIAVNDDDFDAPNARYQLRWAGEAHVESTYGTLYFGPREVTAPLVEGPVTIDGIMDETDWEKAAVETITPIEGVLQEDVLPTSEENISFLAYIMHDDTWLYVGVDVTDDIIFHDTEPEGSYNANTWYDDSMEVFIDQDLDHGVDTSNNRYGSPDLIEGQFVITAGNAVRDANTTNVPFFGDAEEDDWYAHATITDNGWMGEMRFNKEMIVDFERVGFNIAVNDDDLGEGNDQPTYQLRWQGTPHVESSYGVLILGSEPVNVPYWMIFP